MALQGEQGISLSLRKKRKWFYAGFIVINLFLSCYYLDIWITPNTCARAIPVLTLYENKTLVVDKYANFAVDVSKIHNHDYSIKAPFTTFLVYPFYSLYEKLGLPDISDSTLKKYPIYIYEDSKANIDGRAKLLPKSSSILIIGDILCGVIPFIIILALSLFAIKQITTVVSPVLIVMLTFYASFLFTFAGAYTSHVLAGFLALAGYLFIKQKNYALSGLIVGLAMACEYQVALLIPVWALTIYLNEKKISKPLLFIVGAIPGILMVICYNHYLTGSFFQTSYSYAAHQQEGIVFNFPKISAFWGLVFSTYRGILYYTPVLIFILWYAIKYGYQYLSKNAGNKMLFLKNGIKNYLLVTVVAYLVIFSGFPQWDAGWTYGPRYLMPMVVIVLYEGIIFISSRSFSSYAFYTVAAAGLLVTWMDKSTKLFEIPNKPAMSNPILDIVIPDFFKHKFNTNTLPVFLFDANPVIAVYLWPLLFITGIIVLTVWYAKVFVPAKNNVRLSFTVAPMLVLYTIIMVFQFTGGRNNLEMNTDGIFGGWPHFDNANQYLDNGDRTNDPFIKKQNYSYAVSEFRKALAFAPTFQDGYFRLGLCFFSQNNPDSAITAFRKTIKLNPRYPLGAKMLGMAYTHKNQFDSAIHYFSYAVQTDSDFGALIDLGATYQQIGNYPMALHYDSLVLKYDNSNQSALHNMSVIQEEMRKKETE